MKLSPYNQENTTTHPPPKVVPLPAFILNYSIVSQLNVLDICNFYIFRDDQGGYAPYDMGGYGGAPMQPPPTWGPSPDMRGPPQGEFNPGQGGR